MAIANYYYCQSRLTADDLMMNLETQTHSV